MPVYEFRCVECDTAFSVLRPMAQCAEPSTCPDCGAVAARQISAPRLAVMSAAQRQAHRVNERSAHEPRAVEKHVCGSGCSHTQSEEAKPGLRQSKSTSRPWMIGH